MPTSKWHFFCFLSNNKKESRKRLEDILGKDPNYREALTLLAQLDFAEGNYEKALVALEKTGEELDKSAELQNMKGSINVARKEWSAAEKAFQTAIAVDSANFTNYKKMLLFYEMRGEKKKSRFFWLK